MRIQLTKKGDYAVRAMLDIVRHYPGLRTTRQITLAMDLPRDFLSQILASLVRNRILTSVAGPTGGYSLARPPDQISLLEVVEVIEGPVAVDECVLGGGSCDWTQVCPLHQAWGQAKTDFTHHLAGVSFENLAGIDEAIRAGTYKLSDHTPPHAKTPPRLGADE